MIKKRLAIYLFFTSLFLFFCPNHVFLANNNEDSQFSVSIVPPTTQKNKELTYFDLMVSPSQEDDLTLIVSNTGKKKKNLQITPTDAFTNQQGTIDYSPREKKDKNDSSLIHPFTKLVDEKKIVALEPGESKQVSFHLKIPKEQFNGLILGGFVITPIEISEKKQNNQNIMIKNKFELKKAVMIRESEEIIIPELKINHISIDSDLYIPNIAINIQNTQPSMFGDMTIHAVVVNKKNNQVIKDQTSTKLEMAPNSNFNYPIYWHDTPFEEGDYNLKLDISSGEKSWYFKKDFEITKEDSTKFAKYYEQNNQQSQSPFNKELLLILIISAISILLITSLFILYLLKNKKNPFFIFNRIKKR